MTNQPFVLYAMLSHSFRRQKTASSPYLTEPTHSTLAKLTMAKEEAKKRKDEEEEEEEEKELQEEADGEESKKRRRKRKRKRKKAEEEAEETDAAKADAEETPAEDDTPRTVFIEGVPYDSTPEQVAECLQKHAKIERSDITDMRFPTWQDSGRMRGYGHVVFLSKDILLIFK